MAGFSINPNFDFRRFGGNALQDIGYGLTQAPTIWGGLGAGVQRQQEMQPYRDAAARLEAEDQAKQQTMAQQAALRAKYADFFKQNGQNDWAMAVADGLVEPGSAYMQWMQGKQPEAPVKGIEINGQLVNPITGEPMGDFRTPESDKPRDPPAGYQWTPDGKLSFIPGGPADPASAAANKGDTEQTRRAKQLATVVNPQLRIALDNFDSMSEGGNQFANSLNQGSGVGTSPQYQQARNAVQTIAQSYLYSVSGAAAPAEEVKKLVDSVTPVPFESPQSVADKKARLQSMVEAINLMAQGGSGTATTAGVVDYTDYFK